MRKWWPLLIIPIYIAIAVAAALRGEPEPQVAWINSDAGTWYSSLAIQPGTLAVESSGDTVKLLSPDTGEELAELEIDSVQVFSGPDGTVMVQSPGKLMRIESDQLTQVLNTEGKFKHIWPLDAGGYYGYSREQGYGYLTPDGSLAWSVTWPGKLLATETDFAFCYSLAWLGWLCGIDTTTGKVLWERRAEETPYLLEGQAVALRASTVELVKPDGSSTWKYEAGEKLTDARTWAGGVYVLGHANIYALDNQGKLLWRKHVPPCGIFYASRAGLLILRSEEEIVERHGPEDLWQKKKGRIPPNERTILRAVTPEGKRLWVWSGDEKVYDVVSASDSDPASKQASSRVYAVMKSGVVALDPK